MDIIFFFGLLIPQFSVRVYHKKVFSGNVDDWETEQMSITCAVFIVINIVTLVANNKFMNFSPSTIRSKRI